MKKLVLFTLLAISSTASARTVNGDEAKQIYNNMNVTPQVSIVEVEAGKLMSISVKSQVNRYGIIYCRSFNNKVYQCNIKDNTDEKY